MTIHSQFWSPQRLQNVKLVAIDSLLSCKTQEVPKHDILQGLERALQLCQLVPTQLKDTCEVRMNTFICLKAITLHKSGLQRKSVHTMNPLC